MIELSSAHFLLLPDMAYSTAKIVIYIMLAHFWHIGRCQKESETLNI